MAVSDAAYFAQRNQAYRLTFPLYDANGDLVSGAAGLDSEVSKDAGSFVDCTQEAVEIGSSGVYYLDLTESEMDAATVVVQVKSSSAKPHLRVIETLTVDLDDLAQRLGPWTGDSPKNSIYGALRTIANTADGFACSDLVKDDGDGAGDFNHSLAALAGIDSLCRNTILWEGGDGGCIAQSGSSLNGVIAPLGFSTINNKYFGAMISIHSGLAAGDMRRIQSYDAATRLLTPDRPFSNNVLAGDIFVLHRDAPQVTTTFDKDTLVDLVWNESTSGHGAPGSAGAALSNTSSMAGTLNLLTILVTSSGVAIANNAITSAKIASGALTADKFADDAITAAKVAADVHQEAAEVLLDRPNAVETGWTLRGLFRVMGAILAGKAFGADIGSPVYRDLNDTKDRVTATTSNGNRSAVTYDQT